jgi:hypothetical protein
MEPYCAFPPPPNQPVYVEFSIGDCGDELGIIDRKYGPEGASNPPGGAVTYWHVDDREATVKKLLEMGATEYEPVTARGDSGFTTRLRARPLRQHPGCYAQSALSRGD